MTTIHNFKAEHIISENENYLDQVGNKSKLQAFKVNGNMFGYKLRDNSKIDSLVVSYKINKKNIEELIETGVSFFEDTLDNIDSKGSLIMILSKLKSLNYECIALPYIITTKKEASHGFFLKEKYKTELFGWEIRLINSDKT
jgi:hypothetical protein